MFTYGDLENKVKDLENKVKVTKYYRFFIVSQWYNT